MRTFGYLPENQRLHWQVGFVTLAILGTIGVAWFLVMIWPRLVPVFEVLLLATLLAILAAPLVRMMARFIPRVLASSIALVLVLAILVALVSLLVPLFRSELKYLEQNLPTFLTAFRQGLQEFARSLGPLRLDVSLEQFIPQLTLVLERALVSFVTFGLSLGGSLLRLFFFGALSLLTAFYLTFDGPRLFERAFRWAQRRWPWATQAFFGALLQTLWRYFRSVILVSLLGGMTTTVGCWALGVPYPWLLGLAAFFGNFIPYIGPILSFVLGITLCLGQPWSTTFSFILVFFVVNLLVNYLFSPLFLSEQMSLNPLLVMLTVLVGGMLFGFWGAILAVPLLAMAQTTWHFFRKAPLG